MLITESALKRVIREELLHEYGPESRGAPGHRGADGNWVDPGMDGYNPFKDKTLGPDGGYPPEERTAAIRAYTGRDGYIANSQVDPSWVHPAFRR